MEIVRRRVEQYAIDCDLRWGYCDLANKPGDYQGFREDMEELQALGYRHEMRLVPAAEMRSVVGSDRYVGGLVDMGSGHLHPLNLVLGEAAAAQSLGVRLFERSPVTRIDYGTEVQVHTATGKVRAKTLVLGCNAYMNDLNPLLGGRYCRPAPRDRHRTAGRETGPPPCRRTWRCGPARGPRLLPASPTTACCSVAFCHFPAATPATSRRLHAAEDAGGIPAILANVRIDYHRGGMIGIGANRLPQIGPARRGSPTCTSPRPSSGHGVNATHLAGCSCSPKPSAASAQSDGFDLFAKVVPHITFPAAKRFAALAICWRWAWPGTGRKENSVARAHPRLGGF
ncbi:NAD(P)/FAD-dependent oxidoreductase [Pseudomonas aeruginosa]